MKLIVANWKLYLGLLESVKLAKHIVRSVPKPCAQVVICPTALTLAAVGKELQKTSYLLGAQDAGIAARGAYTGELSPADLRHLGCRYVIVGHSERRELLGENDLVVRQKLEAALAAGLHPILCVGETLAERREGETQAIIRRQLTAVLKNQKSKIKNQKMLTIAYEPVWAISAGPGRPVPHPTLQEIVVIHQFIRKVAGALLGKSFRPRIIYGGSVEQKTLPQLLALADVDGVLVGGASTKPSFIEMLETIH